MPWIFILIGIMVIDLIVLITIKLKEKKKSENIPSEELGLDSSLQDNHTKDSYTDLDPRSRRKYFRVYFEDKTCSLEFINFDNSESNKLIHKQLEGTVEDISAGDIKFFCPYNVQIKNNVVIQIEFELEEKSFKLNGEIARKEEFRQSDMTAYGV